MKRLLAALAVLALVGALAVPALASTKKVAVRDFSFSPRSETVSKGTTVKWVWHGRAMHNVTVTRGPARFHSRTFTKGSYSKKLTKRGTYRIICTVHPTSMKLTLKVK